jgi:ABC-type multidrug transport system fused ATPase/permease subunit
MWELGNEKATGLQDRGVNRKSAFKFGRIFQYFSDFLAKFFQGAQTAKTSVGSRTGIRRVGCGQGCPCSCFSLCTGMKSRFAALWVTLKTYDAKSAKTDDRYPTGELVRRLLALAWRFRFDCIISLVLSLALLLLALLGLQLLGVVIDEIRYALDPTQRAPIYPYGWTPPVAWTPLQIVTALSLVIIVQAIVRAVLTYQYNMVTAKLTQGKIVPELRDRIYAKLQRLSFRFFDVHGSSSIFNRVTGDVQSTRLFVDGVVLQGINMVLSLGIYSVFMWKIHPTLTLACLSVTAGLWWVTRYYSARLRPGYERNRELFDNMVQLFSESVRGMQTVKSFAAEGHQIGKFGSANHQVSGQQRRIFQELSTFTSATQFLSQFSLVILFAYGGWLYVHNQIPLGAGLVVFAGLLQQFNGQVANITTIANSVQQSFTAARRVFEVLDTRVEVESKPGAIVASRLSGGLTFENVMFAYNPGVDVIRDLSFESNPGQVIGIFGKTGAGKSTLLGLIPRFFDPQQGRILADGQDLRDLDLDVYRRQIGIVYQESFLFSNTVTANIAFGNPHATQEQIEKAARVASAHEFVMALPHGYDTVLGESGVDLSGGQRQRLALARALLLQPPILVLDDPTASVDPKTEHEITTALNEAMKGRTTFIISNRISVLRRADVILVLDGGRLVQKGTHDELAHMPGPYHETALLQLMDLAESRKDSA